MLHFNISWVKLVVIATGGMSVALALTLLTEWYPASQRAIEAAQGLAPTAYSTILGFLGSAIGLLAFAFDRHKLVLFCGAMVAAAGLIELSHYIFSADFDLNEILAGRALLAEAPSNTHMALGTALGLSSAGTALLLLACPQPLKYRPLVLGFLGALIIAAGMARLSAYLFGFTPVDWGERSSMASLKTAGLLVLGLATLIIARSEARVDRDSVPHWFPLIVGFATAATTVLLWQALLSHDRLDTARIVQSMAQSIKSEIAEELENAFQALLWMARRWDNEDNAPTQAWGTDAHLYLSHDPTYRAAGWVDSSLHLQWITRRMGNGLVPGANLSADARRRQALVAARGSAGFVLQSSFRPDEKGTWLELYIPVVQGTKLHGFLIGVINAQPVLDTVMSNIAREFYVALYEDGKEIYRYPRTGVEPRMAEWKEAEIRFHGATWKARVWPGAKLLAEMKNRVPALILIVGTLGSLLLGRAVQLAQIARLQAHKLRDANRELLSQIAERLQAEDALREQETSYRALAENLPGMVYRLFLHGDHRMQWFNNMSLPMTGCTVSELTEGNHLSFGRLVLAEDKPKLRAALRRALRQNKPFELEYRIQHRNGEIRHFHERGVPVRGPDRTTACCLEGVIIDVTEHRRLEQFVQGSEATLKALSAELLTVQEKERQRIARELHDSIGQSLTSIKFLAENTITAIRNRVSKKGLQSLQQAITMVQVTVEEVRRISMDLRPSMLDDLGILPTISWLCRQFRAAHPDIVVETEIDLIEADIPGDLKTCIFRITQEAMNNVAKHASADRVHISLKKLDGQIELTVEDNGQGFDPAALVSEDGARRGFGLASMRERADLSSGNFRIESQKGKGTAVRVAWPIPELQKAQAIA